MKAYATYVRPLLEYAVHVWSPYWLENIARIESVQRRFTKRLSGLSNDNYSSRLATLGKSPVTETPSGSHVHNKICCGT